MMSWWHIGNLGGTISGAHSDAEVVSVERFVVFTAMPVLLHLEQHLQELWHSTMCSEVLVGYD